jgi:hypothetical protein
MHAGCEHSNLDIPCGIEAHYRFPVGRTVVLRFANRARDYGFSSKRIGLLLALFHPKAGTTSIVRQMALQQVADIQEQVCELLTLSEALERLASYCDGGSRSNCGNLSRLAKEGATENARDTGCGQ